MIHLLLRVSELDSMLFMPRNNIYQLGKSNLLNSNFEVIDFNSATSHNELDH